MAQNILSMTPLQMLLLMVFLFAVMRINDFIKNDTTQQKNFDNGHFIFYAMV